MLQSRKSTKRPNPSKPHSYVWVRIGLVRIKAFDVLSTSEEAYDILLRTSTLSGL